MTIQKILKNMAKIDRRTDAAAISKSRRCIERAMKISEMRYEILEALLAELQETCLHAARQPMEGEKERCVTCGLKGLEPKTISSLALGVTNFQKPGGGTP